MWWRSGCGGFGKAIWRWGRSRSWPGPLAALQGLAGRCGAAFILVAGLRDSAGSKAAATRQAAVTHSPGLAAAARSVWVLSRDPDDPLRRLFISAKNNLGAEARGYAWRLAGGKVQWEAERIEKPVAPEPARGRRLAAAFIADFLKDGPRMWGVVEFNARQAGHRPASLERARGSVAEPFKRTGTDGRWLWRLIGDERTGSEGDIADLFGSGEGIGFAGRHGRGGKSPRHSPGPAEMEPDEDDDDEEEEDDDDDEDDDD